LFEKNWAKYPSDAPTTENHTSTCVKRIAIKRLTENPSK
jgi:hypothetical protein